MGRWTLQEKKLWLLKHPDEKPSIWQPNLKQRAYFEAIINSPPDAAMDRMALARRTGINFNTIYRWHKNPQFLEWIDTRRTMVSEGKLDVVWQAVYEKAVGGNVPAAKLFVERFDSKYKPTVKSETDVTHHLPELSEDEQGDLERARLNFQRQLAGETNVQGVTVAALGCDWDDQSGAGVNRTEAIDGELSDGGGSAEAV